MGLHVIIGKGNLGLDLQIELAKAGHDARLFTPSGEGRQGWEWPECSPMFHNELRGAECVWVAAGGASVGQCEDIWSLEDAWKSLFYLPTSLALELPKGMRLGIFSSDYAADESEPKSVSKRARHPKSIYAVIKIAMEQAIFATNRPLTTVFRIGSLYGGHFPGRTFPGKISANHMNTSEARVPTNWVSPTPSWWVAEKVVQNYSNLFQMNPRLEHIAPSTGCTIIQWARAVLGPEIKIIGNGFDEKRPRYSEIGLSFSSQQRTWVDLWEEHMKRWPQFPGHRKSCTPMPLT